MAQPVFEEHPLQEYLRESGELYTPIPGISAELEREIDLNYGIHDDEVATPDNESDSDWCTPIIIELLKLLETVASLTKPQTRTSPFVERFKYNVISSSLLELSMPSPSPQRKRRSLRIPGNLQHSRASSMDLDHSPALVSSTSEQSYGPLSISSLLTAFFVGVGYPFLAFLSLVATFFLLYNVICMTETPKNDMSLSLNALEDLVAANDTWDSVVQDAMVYLEHEDNNLHSSTGPHSPSPIRVALNSCLQVTQAQCDNIRHLFSALTSPDNLSQLSEMYAPPSPVNVSTFSPELPTRPLSINSLPSDSRFMASPTTPRNKRSTWTGGSYSSLAYAGSPTTALSKRRERRKADVSSIFHTGASSAPNTPFTSIPNGQELNDGIFAREIEEDEVSPGATNFGAAALSLQRRRRSGGMEAFRMPPASYFGTDLHGPRSARNSMFASSSKFTKSTPTRHPLSLSSLNLSLQGTLAARRHACSQLLALRFDEEEDEGYWEDVRSVMSLLSSAFIDGYSRLSEALMEVEQQKLRDQNPTPIACSEYDLSDIPNSMSAATSLPDTRYRSTTSISFAPMPSNISRFAAHVSAISSALDDARSHLEECISALKADAESTVTTSPSKRPRHARSGSGPLSATNDNDNEDESQALQAYERLRRELGLALRECERGRSSLLDVLNPPVEPSDEDEELDDLPGLGHDASDDSDKADPSSPYDDEAEAAALAAARYQTAPTAETGDGDGALIDDATTQLLLGTSVQYLPLPGIEEVYEADTGAKVTFKREKSKLSREERIKIAKARRESGMGLSIGVGGDGEGDESTKPPGVEKWGPGGEVVQELKDVIWKVGERRRMMTTAAPTIASTPAEVPVDLFPSEMVQSATLEST